MKKKIMIFSLLVLVISISSTSFVNGNENQGIEQHLIQNDSGIIYGLSHVYYKLSYRSMEYGISWSFSGVSDSIDVWLFEEWEYYDFAAGRECVGYHLCDANDNYISKSGKLQIPDYFTYYLVYYNPHVLRIHYSDISCSAHSIYAQFDSVTYKAIDDDNDGFDDKLKVSVTVSFDTSYWTEGYVKIYAYLYNEEGKVIDTRNDGEYIENSESFVLILQNHYGKDLYTAKTELYSFAREETDDSSKSSISYKLYNEGHLTRILMWSGIGCVGVIIILVITLLVVIPKRRKKRSIIQEEPIQQNLCPNCKKEIAETGHKFCEHCGEAL